MRSTRLSFRKGLAPLAPVDGIEQFFPNLTETCWNVLGEQAQFSTSHHLKFIWQKNKFVLLRKHFFFCQKQTWFPPPNGGGAHAKDTKTAGKCGKSASSPYWRSVEDLNGILLEACGSTCNGSKLRWDMKICYFQVYLCNLPKPRVQKPEMSKQ